MKKGRFIDKTLLLEAGAEYDLEIIRTIRIPCDQEYFIATDVNGMRHLIPVVYYTHYRIKPGNRVRCRLDRINCLGRFYFEPEHPFYRVGLSYKFEVVDIKSYGTARHPDYYIASVKDVFGIRLDTEKFRPGPNVQPESSISTLICNVKKIKKARPVLEVSDPNLIS
jgi:hypothetical protein